MAGCCSSAFLVLQETDNGMVMINGITGMITAMIMDIMMGITAGIMAGITMVTHGTGMDTDIMMGIRNRAGSMDHHSTTLFFH
ncbi:hypothetical protein M3201_02685 [Paenibacillus motobuensis]|uniref:hypothetical protein n=1 Tax=Paenibacillus TaxID=44249 RepID=UPI0020400EF8|nr:MULTISPECIES: hypothetical protein [Paenibacillus]MCM3038609.1 hypothetical protein [Paenibacillus lutimineralis]MCM3645713.1 hypothetical protein [Paenibacillus motobuensis]